MICIACRCANPAPSHVNLTLPYLSVAHIWHQDQAMISRASIWRVGWAQDSRADLN